MPRRVIDPEVLRGRFAAGERTTAIARALGIPGPLVSYWRRRLGFPAKLTPPRFDHQLVRALYAEGLSDADIAARVGIKAPARIGRIRRRMGLPAHGKCGAGCVAKQRANGLRRTAELRAVTGRRSLYSLDGERYRQKSRALAERYGLPADLARVQTAVVVALASGPQTALQLAARLKRPSNNPRAYHRFNCSRRTADRIGAKNYLTALVRRGLVAEVRRLPLSPRYALTPLALSLLATLTGGNT